MNAKLNGQINGLARRLGPGPDHRRRRRRSERHRHLFADRLAVPLRPGVDAAADDAADDRHPDAVGAHRLGDRRRPGAPTSPRCARAGSRCCWWACWSSPTPSTSRPTSARWARRVRLLVGRPRRALRGRLRRAVASSARCTFSYERTVRVLKWLTLGAVRLRRGDPVGVGAVAPGGARRPDAVALHPAGHVDERLRVDGGGGAGHHDQPLPVLLAGLAGGGGQRAPARGRAAARASRVRRASTCRASSRTPRSA